MPPDSDDTLLTTTEVAERLRVTEETVRRLARSSKLRGFLIADKTGWRFQRGDVEAFIQDALRRQSERR